MPKPVKLWFDTTLATQLAEKITKVYPTFSSNEFIHDVSSQIDPLEMKDRNSVFAQSLRNHLPDSYTEAVDILIQIMGPENTEETGMFKNFYWLVPVYTFLEEYALEDYDASIRGTYEVTKRSTGEFCIRPLLIQYPEKTIKILEKWSLDQNFHVRRLASEGCRTRLPWGARLTYFIEHPELVKPILYNLKADHIKFVQKSVANNLGDVLKDNPEIGYQWLNSWLKDSPSKETQWIIKHAIRTPLKKDDVSALNISTALEKL